MGGEKRSSKGGRYVGGFLQLFDWNTKSKKKLFSTKHDSPERIKQRKRDEEKSPKSRVRLVDEEGNGAAYSIKGSGDYSCASSVTDDEGYGNRAPSVVAKLMGLDSLPTSSTLEPYSSPFSDTHSLRDLPFRRKDLEIYNDRQIICSSNLNNVEGPSTNTMEPKHQKAASKPIAKFQTEVLPPRSAKSIPITHHKLLSPIKAHGFFPSKDAADIMEAAAKIIEPGFQATPRSKMLSAGASTVPLRVRELKEKLEAAQRPSRVSGASQRLVVEASASKHLKGSSADKSLCSSVDTTSFKFSSDTADSSATLKNKGKSVSLAVQAKVNVLRRECRNSNSGTLDGLKELNDVRHSQPFKSQPHGLKSGPKKSSAHSASSVLRQNNQKQNSCTDKDRLTSKSSGLTSRGRKTVSGSSVQDGRQASIGRDAGTSRTSRKSSLEARECDKEIPYSKVENLPRKKRSIDGNIHHDRSYVVDNMMSNARNPNQFNTVADSQFTFIEESRKKGMDVVSFTFTAPMTRSVAGPEPPSRQVGEKSSSLASNKSKSMISSSNSIELSSFGLNTIGADALSILLEQKLRELTSGLENSDQDIMTTGTSAVRRNFVSADAESSLTSFQGNWSMNSQMYSAFPLSGNEVARRKDKLQGREGMAGYNSDRSEITKLEEGRIPSPESVLEPFPLTDSCYSFDSAASNSTLESKQCSSAQTQKECGLTSSTKDYTVEIEADLSDSASSTSLRGKNLTSSSEWELDYIESILSNVETMFKDFTLARTSEVVNPQLFDQMERRRNSCFQADDENSRLSRKVVFDGAKEYLDLRCKQFVGGGCKAWSKGLAAVRTKGRLAEEVYREIQGWRSMGSRIVDELVDRDMSSQHGKWLDFEVDAFALGMEIESQICDSLIDEMIADIFPLSRPRFCIPASSM